MAHTAESSPVAITDRLRSDILSGVFAPGERLVELQLSDRYGVGRAAVRSALLELASEDLVDRETNRGAVVRRVTIDEAVQITEARIMLEGLVARKAAEVATDSERAELGAIVAAMRDAVDSGDQLEYSKLNASLHGRLGEISGHTVAIDLIANLRNRAVHHQYRLSMNPGRSAVSLPEHAAIVEAVAGGDGSAAERAMHEHLESVADVLRRWADLGVST